MEKEIAIAKRSLELIMAKIFDIADEDIQKDYLLAFEPVRNTCLLVDNLYISDGMTDQTQELLAHYHKLFHEFESEYEVWPYLIKCFIFLYFI